MPPIPKNKYPRNLPQDCIGMIQDGEALDINGWQIQTSDWDPFMRMSLHFVFKTTPEFRISMVAGLISEHRQNPFDELDILKWSVMLLSPEALEKLRAAVALNEMTGVYKNKEGPQRLGPER